MKTHHKHVINDLNLKLRLCYTIGFFVAVGGVLQIGKPPIMSPCPETGCFVKTVYAKDESSELEQVVSYIAHVFQPEGKQVVVKAIQCFYGESGLRPTAYNFNSNKTEDKGIAQINSIWHLEDPYNFKKNIDQAYKIYKRSHSFQAWYAPACR